MQKEDGTSVEEGCPDMDPKDIIMSQAAELGLVVLNQDDARVVIEMVDLGASRGCWTGQELYPVGCVRMIISKQLKGGNPTGEIK